MGRLERDRVLPDYREGLDGIKYHLLNDVNALMKQELLNYDWMIREAAPQAPGLFTRPVSKLDPPEYELLDRLAAYSQAGNVHVDREEVQVQFSSYVRAENLRTEQR